MTSKEFIIIWNLIHDCMRRIQAAPPMSGFSGMSKECGHAMIKAFDVNPSEAAHHYVAHQ